MYEQLLPLPSYFPQPYLIVLIYFWYIAADFPSEANEYVYKALAQVLEPVMAGANQLSTTAQLSLVSLTVTKMCEAWTAFILKEKIRFR